MIAVSNVRSSFALKNNGTLWGWGANSSGLLGESTTTVIQTPTQINPDTDWKTISVGEFHILAIKNNNTLWAWGGWGNGETGHNPANAHDPSAPNQILGTNWSKIAAGYRFSLGIKTDGTLWAWGKNDVGQLGDGTTTDKYLPVQIGTDTNWESVSAGYQHVVALKTNGAVVTWGNNDFGQLGNGNTTSTITPAAITIIGCVLNNEGFNRENDGVVLAPNPTTGKVFLDGVGLYQSVGVYNYLGQEVVKLFVLQDDKMMVDLSDLPNGVYMVKLIGEGSDRVVRVLKQ